MGEVIKYGIIWDGDLFARLEREVGELLALSRPHLIDIIHRCCAIKAEVVAADERETGQRALLNLGHTFGHAVETLSDYRVLHGHAVGIGMVLAADLSHRLGLCDATVVARIKALCQAAELPVAPPRHSVQDYLDVMSRDKKVKAGKVRFILVDAIGKALVKVYEETRL